MTSGSPSPSEPWEAPSERADTSVEGLAPGTAGAGFGIRGAARGLDGALGWVAVIGGLSLGSALAERLPWPGPPIPWGGIGPTLTIGAALVLAQAVPETIGGATLGKLLLGLRVVDIDGGRSSLRSTLVRGVAMSIDGLFAGLVGFAAMRSNPGRQRLGDQWAETLVVPAGRVPLGHRASLGRIALGVLLGPVVASLLCAATAWVEIH